MVLHGIKIRRWIGTPSFNLVVVPDGTAIWAADADVARLIADEIYLDCGVQAFVATVVYSGA